MKEFDVSISEPATDDIRCLNVSHLSETFDFEYDGYAVSIINNGDNSWSIVEGSLDQETVNLIGTAIEEKMKDWL